MDLPLEQLIATIVRTAVEEALAPYLRRLGDPEPLVYSMRGAAAALETSAHTVKRLIDEGVLATVPHMGERILIPRPSVEALVASGLPALRRAS